MLTRALSLSACPALLLAVACAHAPEATVPGPDWGIARASTTDTFEVGGQADHWGVKVTADQLLAIQPDFALAREGGEIRGRALGLPVVVGFHGDQGAGVYRGAPFTVQVEETPNGIHVSGLFGGAVSSFDVSTERINGRVGVCGWDLRWDGQVYSGSRGCGMRIEPISVSLPATMASWSNVEVAGALALLMNVGAPVPAFDRLANNSAEFRNAPVPDPALNSSYRLASQASASWRAASFGAGAGRAAGAPAARAGASASRGMSAGIGGAKMSTTHTP